MNVPTCKACEACNTNDRITSFVCISDYLFTMSSVISCLFHHYIHTLHTSFVCIFSLPFTATSSGILLPFFTLFFLLMCLSVLPRLVSPGCHSQLVPCVFIAQPSWLVISLSALQHPSLHVSMFIPQFEFLHMTTYI